MTTPSIRSFVRAALLLAALLAARDAAAIAFFLKAAPSTATMPDGRVVPTWGYAFCPDATFLGCDPVSVPGPALVVPADDPVVTITLKNELPVPTSFVVPAQAGGLSPTFVNAADVEVSVGSRLAGDVTSRVRSFTTEAIPALSGGPDVVTYAWTTFAPGTYLYESGTDPAIQVQMGLYGSITRDTAPGEAYPGRTFAEQVTLLYSEIDAAFHDAVVAGATLDVVRYRPAYFLVNGTPFVAGSVPLPAGIAGQAGPTLLRLLNAGLESRVPVLLGAETSVIAENGKPYSAPRSIYAPELAAGSTLDVFATFPADGTYRLFDRRLALTTGTPAPGTSPWDGGALVFLEVAPALLPPAP